MTACLLLDPPEKPDLFCYKKSPSSKIRCESKPQQNITIRPNCYLLLSKRYKHTDTFSLHCWTDKCIEFLTQSHVICHRDVFVTGASHDSVLICG